MAFIYYGYVIFRKIIEQTEWPDAGFSSVKKTGIIFNAVTITQLSDHFNIIVHSFTEPLCFYIFSSFLKYSACAVISSCISYNTCCKISLGPLRIKNYQWTVEKNGLISAWAGLRMRSRDLLKLGLLYLNNGKWNGKKIIPTNLVTQSLKLKVSTPFGNPVLSVGYSNQFWIYSENINGCPITYGQAQGNGGQIVVIDKQNNLVLVTTAGNYDRTNQRKSSWDLYYDFVYPAILKKNSTLEK